MKSKRIFYSLALAGTVSLSFTSCNDFLDTMPDNRTVLDAEDKIGDLLTSAYPTTTYALANELMSDNSDYYGDRNPNGDQWGDDTFFWKDETQQANESMKGLWADCNTCVSNANTALEELAKGDTTTDDNKALRAEALLLRAYGHFLLVSQFSQAYNSQTSSKDLGVPVSTQVEKFLVTKERGTVADVYEQIDKDIQKALPLVTDDYEVPKYHFNRKAAYAFATRFYLFYEKWDKAVQYANECLGANPASMMRNWKSFGQAGSDLIIVGNRYISVDEKANLMISTSYSQMGVLLGAYSLYKRYSHGSYLAKNEDIQAGNIWGSAKLYTSPFVAKGTNADATFIQKVPYLFETTDAVNGTGYAHTALPVFNAEETILNRAEAYAMLGNYDKAAEDLTTWMQAFVNTTATLSPSSIQAFYASKDYAYDDADKLQSSVKKHLHPKFTIDAEGSVQESILQCVLGFRRMVTLSEGFRWWDIKRYGIEIPRREINAAGNPMRNLDWLKTDDPRRAVQIPRNVIDAGMKANPRD